MRDMHTPLLLGQEITDQSVRLKHLAFRLLHCPLTLAPVRIRHIVCSGVVGWHPVPCGGPALPAALHAPTLQRLQEGR